RIDRLDPNATAAEWCAMQGLHGGAESLVRLLPSADALLLTASADQEQRLVGWLRNHVNTASARFWNVTSAHAQWELHGPRRHELIETLTSTLGPEAPGSLRPRARQFAGAAPIEVYEDSLLNVSVILLPAEYACYVWERMQQLGKTFGLRV